MSERDERIERLREVNDLVADKVLEDLADQAKRAAANMLLLYGDKSCLSATGFIYCVQSAHEAALLHLLAEGVVTLTPDSTATPEVVASRKARREASERGDLGADPVRPTARDAAYL